MLSGQFPGLLEPNVLCMSMLDLWLLTYIRHLVSIGRIYPWGGALAKESIIEGGLQILCRSIRIFYWGAIVREESSKIFVATLDLVAKTGHPSAHNSMGIVSIIHSLILFHIPLGWVLGSIKIQNFIQNNFRHFTMILSSEMFISHMCGLTFLYF